MKTVRLKFLVLLFCAISSTAFSQTTFKNSAKWLPPDFDPSKGVLLVENVTKPKRQGEKIEEFMKETYPYAYEIISLKDLEAGGKYSDTAKYRFVIAYSFGRNPDPFKPGGGMRTTSAGRFDFHFLDRSANKDYPETGKFSSWASVTFKPIINTILEKFPKAAPAAK